MFWDTLTLTAGLGTMAAPTTTAANFIYDEKTGINPKKTATLIGTTATSVSSVQCTQAEAAVIEEDRTEIVRTAEDVVQSYSDEELIAAFEKYGLLETSRNEIENNKRI